jgi:hypothetical protein
MLALIAALSAAHAFGLGEGNRLGKLGAASGGGTVTPLTPCTSTGIFDLSNTCNDIYFIGAMK